MYPYTVSRRAIFRLAQVWAYMFPIRYGMDPIHPAICSPALVPRYAGQPVPVIYIQLTAVSSSTTSVLLQPHVQRIIHLSTSSVSAPDVRKSASFQTGQIATIISGHTCHDAFSAFFPPLLPKIQEKLALSYSQLGSLSFAMQIPFISTLLLGYLADRLSVRYFVILAPAVTATMMSIQGLANGFWPLMIIVIVTGFSVAAFHAPAPAMISRVSGHRVGLGMSLFMASGELGRTLGPLLVAGGVTLFGLEGIWRIMVLGWIASAFLFWHLHRVSGRPSHESTPVPLRVFWQDGQHLLSLIGSMVVFRTFLHVALTTYLPLYMRDVLGAEFVEGAFSLTLMEGAGVLGAIAAGTLCDHYSRKNILLVLFGLSSLLVFLFTRTPAHLVYWILPAVGFFTLSTTPVILTIMQTRFPRNRALASSTFMSMGVCSRSVTTWLLGLIADQYGLAVVFHVCILVSLLGILPLWLMPRAEVERR